MKNGKFITRTTLLLLLILCSAIQAAGAEEGFMGVLLEEGRRYGISEREGFFFSPSRGGSYWIQRSSGLPKRIIYPFSGEEGYRELTGIGVDPGNPDRVVLGIPYGLYYSSDAGLSWDPIPVKPPLKPAAYITSAAITEGKGGDLFLAGTSFSGLYLSKNRGKSWISLNDSLEGFYRGAGFYEEISGAAFHPENENLIFLAKGFGGGLFLLNRTDGSVSEIPFPGAKDSEVIRHIHMSNFELMVTTEKGTWLGRPPGGDDFFRFSRWIWKRRDYAITAPREIVRRNSSRAGRAAVENNFGMYAASQKASGDALENHILFAKENGFNSMVVDMKDDNGKITYDTGLVFPVEIGGVQVRFSAKELIERAHKEGIRIIGRIVVFQDPVLYSHENGKYAIWNKEENAPWGYKINTGEDEEPEYVQREFWVDPYSEFVWAYNIAIGEELEALGIDEIQFDYIRFPSDGDVWNGTFRYKKPGMEKTDALESFLAMAREKISIPIGADLYGFNSFYRMGNWIGQNLELFSRYVDVVSPMFYPSHFPRNFMEETAYLPRAERIYREGSRRALLMAEEGCVIRPFIQAFLIGGELNFEEPVYHDYLIRQLKGARDGGASGFTLWNASNRYYMVVEPLVQYTRLD